MRLNATTFISTVALLGMLISTCRCVADEKKLLAEFRAAAKQAGDATLGKLVFDSKQAACSKCHRISGGERLAGPPLSTIGDKYDRDQLIRSVLEPNASLHPDYVAQQVRTVDGQTVTGVLRNKTEDELQLLDAEGKLVRVPLADIDQHKASKTSLMPSDVHKSISKQQFADLIAYLTTLRQTTTDRRPGLPSEIPKIAKPVRLTPFHSDKHRFDHPVWIIAKPGAKNEYLIVEQKTRKIFRLKKNADGDSKELFVDMSGESITGQFEGVMCLAFHPRFAENRKYYLNYHVRHEGIVSPVIVQRQAIEDLSRDVGGESKRLLQIIQPTNLHWGGMLAFGPDGYLYIGAGDGGPQEDPRGHGQDLSTHLGKILRIDVDRAENGKPYAIPDTNPFKGKSDKVRPEIWAYGFRMPWRFSWDTKTDDLWVGDIGQILFEEVSIVRVGENHGWNVFEGHTPFSDQYRRANEKYIPPVISYRRKFGVSVTGGYVYRGKRSPSYVGAYIFADFESKRIWALKQTDRKLVKVRQIGECPEKPASFGIDHDGELFVVGYQGTIFRLMLDDSVFE